MHSRLFYLKPPLFNSKSKIENLDLSGYVTKVSEPVDNRRKFYGEVVYKRKTAEPLDEFFEHPTMFEIQNKIESDLRSFHASQGNDSHSGVLVIQPTVEIFYPDVRGFIWSKSFAKVRMVMIAKLDNKELIDKTYESFYITDGTDKEFEGSMTMTIEQGANVTIGMALRKALDDFYSDLRSAL
jgi:hypothetical protein